MAAAKTGFLFLALALVSSGTAHAGPISVGRTSAASARALETKDIRITEHLGAVLPLNDLSFRDDSGAAVKLGGYFRAGRPVILGMVYYSCPNLCNLFLNGLVDGLKKLDWNPGQQFDVVAVSIDPREGPALAGEKKANYVASYGRPATAAGWHFLTGAEDQVHALAALVGFGYRFDPASNEFAHSAAAIVLTPEGKVSRYLYGVQFEPRDLRLALVEASNGKVGTLLDQVSLFCMKYDASARRYSVIATRLLKGTAAAMLLVGGAYLLLFWRGQRKSAQSSAQRRVQKGALTS